ncbi:MAG TPA: hypothetical protein VL356_06835 [Acidocella sp.]|nr:hypothetical protein [Acidocella sp.]
MTRELLQSLGQLTEIVRPQCPSKRTYLIGASLNQPCQKLLTPFQLLTRTLHGARCLFDLVSQLRLSGVRRLPGLILDRIRNGFGPLLRARCEIVAGSS